MRHCLRTTKTKTKRKNVHVPQNYYEFIDCTWLIISYFLAGDAFIDGARDHCKPFSYNLMSDTAERLPPRYALRLNNRSFKCKKNN